MRCLFFVLAGLLLASLYNPPIVDGGDEALRISRVQVSPQQRRIDSAEDFVFSFDLSLGAAVTISLYDSRNRLVKRVATEKNMQAGFHQVSWDGSDESGRPVVPNYYLYTITARHPDHGSITYDPSDLSGGDRFSVERIHYDRNTKRVHFSLPHPAIVNLRAGLGGGGPLLATLLDWVALPAGSHEFSWDGMDRSGVVQIGRLAPLEFGGIGYELPLNHIIVTDDVHVGDRPRFIDGLDSVAAQRVHRPVRQRMLDHWRHPRERCYDPLLKLRVLDAVQRREDGALPVDGPINLRVDVARTDRKFLLDQRFEIVYYVDFIFVGEEELGYLPFTWRWDPAGISPGEHYLSVMLRGYEGHFGSATTKVIVAER
jgi:hypothetical protein